MSTEDFQHFSGKPWAATTQIVLPQGDHRVLLEPRGSRRLASQSLLDVRLSRTIVLTRAEGIKLLVGLLNALNDTAAENLAQFLQPEFQSAQCLHGPAPRDHGRKAQSGR